MLTLFILPKKGLYQLTLCQNCGHIWGCPNCDANLITYRSSDKNLELFCHQCQTYHTYPTKCPKCNQNQIISKYGGIDDLDETLKAKNLNPYRLDKEKISKKLISPIKLSNLHNTQDFLITRLFDPSIKYNEFDRIIFVNAENLMASPDYLVEEDTTKSLIEVFLRVKPEAKIIFDTPDLTSNLMQRLAWLHPNHPHKKNLLTWYFEFLESENMSRSKFGFPPHKNVLLLTTQERQKQNAFAKLKQIQIELRKYLPIMPDLEISNPYPARFFKRKNMYSQHLLIKYPRQYQRFSSLREIVTDLASAYQVQVRLNPRHLF